MALPQPNPYERLIINIGTAEDDGTGDPIRNAFGEFSFFLVDIRLAKFSS